MVVDACRRLPAVERLDQYQYVGFGGLEFIDFVEFHIALGLKPMTSIERNRPQEGRFLFNKPYESITLLMGESRDRLAEIDWASQRAIVWLDYTDQLSTNILRDVDYVTRTARPGSMLVVTINGGVSTVMTDRLPNLKKKLGDLVDPDLTDQDMKLSGATREQKRILAQHVSAACREAHGHPFIQLFDFQYADVSPMHTWGGLIVDEETAQHAEHCHFKHLDFVRGANEQPVEIEVPFLTEREMDYVLKGLVGDIALPAVSGVSDEDIEKFRAIYRYKVGSR
jgi:hypothetical protein